MANKMLVAVTRIKYDGGVVIAGEPLDPKKLTKEQIRRLYDLGSIKVVDVPVTVVKAEPAPTPVKTEPAMKVAPTPVKAETEDKPSTTSESPEVENAKGDNE